MLTKTITKKSSFICALFLVALIFPHTLFAQTRPIVNIDITPENYSPNEQVTVSASSFNIQIDSVEIEWFVDGKTFKKGFGLKQVRVEAPDSGTTREIRVVVTQKDQTIEKKTTLRPETLELYIESIDGYTPVWYLGRSQIAEESIVKVVAVPDSFNAVGGDSNRVYTWSKDSFKDPRQSGRGRQVFVSKLSPFVNSENITIEVGGTAKTIVLKPYSTSLSLYEYSPLVGTRFEKELSSKLDLTKEDVTFEVVPWFFSALDRNSSGLSVSWTVNGLPTKTQSNRSLLNLRKGSTQKGKADVGVTVKHKERTLQSNKATLTIDL